MRKQEYLTLSGLVAKLVNPTGSDYDIPVRVIEPIVVFAVKNASLDLKPQY